MKDYLLSFSLLGLFLGFYSALVFVQSKPAHAGAHDVHLGSMNTPLGHAPAAEKVSENKTVTDHVPNAADATGEVPQEITR